MKKASIIFIALSLLFGFLAWGLWGIACFENPLPGSYVIWFFLSLIDINGIALSIIGFVSLANDQKNTAVGVLLLIFVSFIGGILYLCWTPTPANPPQPNHIVTLTK